MDPERATSPNDGQNRPSLPIDPQLLSVGKATKVASLDNAMGGDSESAQTVPQPAPSPNTLSTTTDVPNSSSNPICVDNATGGEQRQSGRAMSARFGSRSSSQETLDHEGEPESRDIQELKEKTPQDKTPQKKKSQEKKTQRKKKGKGKEVVQAQSESEQESVGGEEQGEVQRGKRKAKQRSPTGSLTGIPKKRVRLSTTKEDTAKLSQIQSSF